MSPDIMQKIHVLIFSRDRAMQLDAVLRSFFLHCRDAASTKIEVLYTTTSEQHARQYAELRRDNASHSNLAFVREGHFRSDVITMLVGGESLSDRLYRSAAHWYYRFGWLLGWIVRPTHPSHYVLFLVDDNLFVRNFRLADSIAALERHPDLLGVSLRLGRNTTFCYSLAKPQALPHFQPFENKILVFEWATSELDFSYPLEVSSSVYRMDDLLAFIIGLPFHNPNWLEGQMAARRMSFRRTRPQLACFEKSLTFCNPVNMVQSVVPNRAGQEIYYSAEDLAERFERGERIDVAAYNNFTPNACHHEVPLVFKRRENLDA